MPTTNKRVLINGCSCLVSREFLQYTRFLTLIKIKYGILIVLAVMTLVILTINLGERLIPSVQTVPTLVVLIFNPRCLSVPHSASCFIVGKFNRLILGVYLSLILLPSLSLVNVIV